MITIKPIQTTFNTLNNQTPFNKNNCLKRRVPFTCLSKSNDGSDSESPGDSRKQELLAKIAQIQTQKVRLSDYLDERSDFLTQFAEEANAEIDLIGENALRELDEAGQRIMGNIESKMQAFEESMEMNKTEVEENEKKLAEFEVQIEDNRNEGMFFKNLGKKTPIVDKEKAVVEMQIIKEITKRSADSTIRRNIYFALIGLVVTGILDAVISSSSSSLDLRKMAILGAVLIGLISQVTYEQIMFKRSETNGEQKNEDEKKP